MLSGRFYPFVFPPQRINVDNNFMFSFYEMKITAFVCVVVQFGFWFNFDFPLFFSMLIYDNEYQTKENQN